MSSTVASSPSLLRGRLFAAAWRGERAQLEEALAEDASLVHAEDENGVTALRFAAQFGHVDLARLLLDRGAKVDAASKDGMTPLMAAAEAGQAEAVALLLARGADANARAGAGGTTNALLLARKGRAPPNFGGRGWSTWVVKLKVLPDGIMS